MDLEGHWSPLYGLLPSVAATRKPLLCFYHFPPQWQTEGGSASLFFRASLVQALTLRTLVTRKLKQPQHFNWAVVEPGTNAKLLQVAR